MRPKKIFRDTSSNCSSWAMKRGSRSGTAAASGISLLPFQRFFFHLGEDFYQKGIGRQVFGLRFEIQKNTVPQRGQINPADVAEADVVAAIEERTHLTPH